MPTPNLVRAVFNLLVLIALAGGALRGRAAEVPRTPLEYARDLESADRDVRREAAYQLSRMGRDARVALPQLIQALQDDQQQVWFGAVTALAHLGPDAEPALPALMRDLEEWQPFRRDRQGTQALYRTAVALGAIGPAALPALTEALEKSTWHVRAGGAMALGLMGEAARSAAPRLVQLLGDERAEVRVAAAEAVAIVAPAEADAVAGLAQTAAEPATRLAALDALRRIGPAAARVLPTVQAILATDPDTDVRVGAVRATARISGRDGNGLPSLLEAWRSGQSSIQAAAEQELLLVTRPWLESVLIPAIVADLKSSDRRDRTRAAALMVNLGSEARSAAPEVVALLRSRSADTPPDEGLAAALGAMGEAALPLVLDDLKNRGSEFIRDSDWTLAVLRTMPSSALPVLANALTNAHPTVRLGALEGVTALGPAAQAVVDLLPPLWMDPDPRVRTGAWVAAARCGMSAERYLAEWDRGLADSDRGVRVGVVDGIARLGPPARYALPRLLGLLGEPDPALRRAAIRALGGFQEDAREAVSPLAQRLNDADSEERVAVLEALGRIGRPAADVTDDIQRQVDADEVVVRRAAIETLSRLGEAGAAAAPRLAALARGDRDVAVRASSVTALVAVAEGDEATVGVVLGSLDDPAVEVRLAALSTLAVLGERGRPAEARVFALLEREEERAAAIDGLKAIHPVSVEALQGALGHGDWSVREMAADSLARLGKAAAPAVPALEKAQRDDPHDAVKRAARRALRRVRDS